MKRQKLFVCAIVTLVVALVMAPALVAAKAIRTECSGTETLTGYLDPGVWTFPGDNIHVRGMTSQYEEASSCPQNSGVNTTTMNANWDANYTGPMWGTFHLETPYAGGGIWEGTWQGKINADGACSYTGVGHGVSGSVIGLKLTLNADCTGAPATFTSVILDPHGD